MKLIKKIAAIMFAFMMVFSLSTNVKAVSGVNQNQGSITISNAKAGETYKIYRILDLASYNYSEGDHDKGNYSYTYKTGQNDTEWKQFIVDNTGDGKYFSVTDGKYLTANGTANGEDIAKDALKFVQDSDTITADASKKPETDGPITFSDLPLGYYLVESTVGALCSLNTTHTNQNIEVKYEEPTITKTILMSDSDDTTHETVKIGDSIMYQITIDVKKGAKNYVLHDQLDPGLKYHEIPDTGFSVHAYVMENNKPVTLRPTTDYLLTHDKNANAFTLKFEDSCIKNLVDKQINVDYYVNVTKGALMDTAMKNKAFLNYGNSQTSKESTTSVFTYQIPVYKYTGEGANKKPLANATFNLYKDSKADGNLLRFDGKIGNVYTYNKDGEVKDLVSGDDGYVKLNGLSAGTYFLEETKAPNGYNKLENPIKIVVTKADNTKKITRDDVVVTQIDVENKSGSLLPSTGGMGTTLIYLIGGALVLGSGFVLANKKRAKAK